MSQRRIRERGGDPNKGEGSSERESLFEREASQRGGGLSKRRLIREGVSSGREYIEERSLSDRV